MVSNKKLKSNRKIITFLQQRYKKYLELREEEKQIYILEGNQMPRVEQTQNYLKNHFTVQ